MQYPKNQKQKRMVYFMKKTNALLMLTLMVTLSSNVFVNAAVVKEPTIINDTLQEETNTIDASLYAENIKNGEIVIIDLGNGGFLKLEQDLSITEPRLNETVTKNLGSSYTFLTDDDAWLGVNLSVTNESKNPGSIDVKAVLGNASHTEHEVKNVSAGSKATLTFGAGSYTVYAKASYGSGNYTMKISDGWL